MIDTTRFENVLLSTSTDKTTISNQSFYKQDLNKALVADLKKIRGIRPVLSERILKYGYSINGFSNMNQLYQVYGSDSIVVD